MDQLKSLSLSFKCPKAFNQLQPCEGGWYCNGCHKLVHDFRGKPEQEIQDIFAANNYQLCGLFEADRIRVAPPLPKWRKWAAAAVLTLGFTGLHQVLMAQQLSKADSLALSEKSVKKIPAMDDANEIFGGVSEITSAYPGGTEKFQKYIADNLVPEANSIPGQKGFFYFEVEIDGTVTDVAVLRSPFSKTMNEQIISIIKKSKRWHPGMQNGKGVKQGWTVPVTPLPK